MITDYLIARFKQKCIDKEPSCYYYHNGLCYRKNPVIDSEEKDLPFSVACLSYEANFDYSTQLKDIYIHTTKIEW